MPGENIQDWSVTAIDNGAADSGIDWREHQTRASVNNSARSVMAALAKNRNLQNGSIVTTGTPNVQAFQSGLTYTVIPTGLVVKLKVGPSLTNTGPLSLNMDGIGDVTVKTADGLSTVGREFIAGSYVDLIFDGTNWIFLYSQAYLSDRLGGGAGIVIGQQIFATAGNFVYTPTAGMEACIIECVAGGGGGGGASNAPVTVLGGGGGGSGGYSRKLCTAAQITASQPLTVGAGGVGASNVSGTAGGDTFVGASYATCLIGAKGGGGGGVAHPTTDWIFSGAGGAPGVGDVTAAGSPGGAGEYGGSAVYTSSTGQGGSSVFGGGGAGSQISAGGGQNGIAGRNYGAGGSGGNTYDSGTAAGGSGSPGVIIITEFAGRGAPGRDGAPGPIGPSGPAGPGTGNVLTTGTPAAGQYAQWVDASHIQGVDPLTYFTTGDAKPTFKTVADAGWIMLNDGSIGDATSGATTRANADTSALFTLMYTNITALVVQDSTGATVSRGASAAADFAAHRRLVLPKALGRALGVAGAGAGLTARTLGSITGAETETPTIAKTAAHSHTDAGHSHGLTEAALGISSTALGSDYYVLAQLAPTYTQPTTNAAAALTNTGSGTPLAIMQPTTFINVMVKL